MYQHLAEALSFEALVALAPLLTLWDMKKTDMELQAIREKLQLLEAEPPAAETLSLPWAGRRLIDSDQSTATHKLSQHQGQSPVTQSPQAIAIEALKQRSGNALLNAQQQGQGNTAGATSQAENLIAKELYKLEIQAHNINVRSQQQAEDIISMKRAAQQAIFELSKQGIHDHPHLATITELFDHHPSVAVPHIERDGRGHFSLTYDTIDINSAQKEAIATANTLRQRASHSQNSHSHPKLFSEPILNTRNAHGASSLPNNAAGLPTNAAKETLLSAKAVDISTTARAKKRINTSLRNIVDSLTSTRRKRPHALDSHSPHPEFRKLSYSEADEDEPRLESFYAGNSFSWLDGAIWFSGAAIARIGIELAVVSYPWLATPLLIGLVSTIVFVIYRVLNSKSSDYSDAYRLFIAMLGIFSIGLF